MLGLSMEILKLQYTLTAKRREDSDNDIVCTLLNYSKPLLLRIGEPRAMQLPFSDEPPLPAVAKYRICLPKNQATLVLANCDKIEKAGDRFRLTNGRFSHTVNVSFKQTGEQLLLPL